MKRYSVAELSKISGVSVRSLHHYDKIGLLSPALRTEKKYRVYGEYELYRLQQILFYKELGVSLSQIGIILDDRNFNQDLALQDHKENLIQEKERIELLLVTIDNTIEKLKGKKMITDEELYDGFPKEEVGNIKEEAKKKYGEQAFNTSEKYLKSLTKEDFKILKKDQKDIFRNLSLLKNENIESDKVQLAIAKHYQNIRKFWGTNGSPKSQKDEYRGLGKLYLTELKYTEVDGVTDPLFAEFLCEAMDFYATKQLK